MTSRVVLVTGGTGGIGTAICKRLADQGHRVASNFRNAEKAQAWQQRMQTQGYDIALFRGDVASSNMRAAWSRTSRQRWGRSKYWSTTPASPATPPSIA